MESNVIKPSPIKVISEYKSPIRLLKGFNEIFFIEKSFLYLKEKRGLCFDLADDYMLLWDFINIDGNIKEDKTFFHNNNIVHIPPHIDSKFISFVNICKSRFVAIPLILTFYKGNKRKSAHFNILIYDRYKKELYRYEPNGTCVSFYNSTRLEYYLEHEFIRLFPEGAIYIPITQSCSHEGLQRYESRCDRFTEEWRKRHGNVNVGFCQAWSMFLLDMRLKYPDIPSKDLEKQILSYFGRTHPWTMDIDEYMQTFIQEYALHILGKEYKNIG